jgi:hypothetical protein
MMSSTNQAVESNKRDWQNYQQSMYKAAQDKVASRNALIASGIAAGGAVAGAMVGGPMGASMGSKLGGMIGGGGGAGGSMGAINPGYQGMENGMRVYSQPGSYRIG